MADGTTDSARNNVLNRTMVINKKAPRPGLPNLEPSPESNQAGENTQEQTTAQPKRQRTSTVTLKSGDSVETLTNEVDERQRMEELRKEIAESLEQKENIMNLTGEAKVDELVRMRFKYDVARQAAEYADKFFVICEKNGIDVAKVLKSDPEVLYQMKLKSSALTPTSAADHQKELTALKTEREHLAEEAKALKASYSNLFKSYEKLRNNFDLLRDSRNSLAEQVEKQRTSMTQMFDTAVELKDVMLEQVSLADQTIAENKGKYDSDTLTIRMNLIQLQNENASLKSEIEGKNNEISELRRIVQEIVKQVQLQEVPE